MDGGAGGLASGVQAGNDLIALGSVLDDLGGINKINKVKKQDCNG